MSALDKQNINISLTEIAADFKAAISVDCVIFGYDEFDLKVLVIESDMGEYQGQFSLLGDLVHIDENLEDAAKRVLKRRTGLADLYMEQVQSFGKVGRHPLGRVITVAYYSLVEIEKYHLQDAEKIGLSWKSIKDLSNLAFDHDMVLQCCVERLKQRLREKPIGFNLLPKKFTLMQLQRLYEVVLDIELDKRNFRRKLKSLDILIDIGELQTAVAHRPARLYKFDSEKYEQNISKDPLHFEL